MDALPEQPQRQRLHVRLLHLAQAHELVAVPVAGIALQEEAHALALELRRRGLREVRLELPARAVELDDAGHGVEVAGEQLQRQLVGERLQVAAVDAPVRMEGLPEDRQVAEGAVALDEQQPVERDVGPLALERAHARDPRERQRLLAPVLALDDGVAGVHDVDRAAHPLALEHLERGEADELLSGVQQQDLVLLREVVEEERLARGLVAREVQARHPPLELFVERGDGREARRIDALLHGPAPSPSSLHGRGRIARTASDPWRPSDIAARSIVLRLGGSSVARSSRPRWIVSQNLNSSARFRLERADLCALAFSYRARA